jgi:hypothetical protein
VPIIVSASRAAFALIPIGASVFCYRNTAGATIRVLGTSCRVTEALAARIILFNNRGLLNFLRLVAIKELE